MQLVRGRRHEVINQMDAVSWGRCDIALATETQVHFLIAGRWRPGARLDVWMQDEDVTPLRSRCERFFDDGEGVVDSRMHIASKRVGRFLRVEQQWLVEWRVIEPVAQRH